MEIIIREMQSKPQWNITSYLLEQLLPKRQEVTSIGEDIEEFKPLRAAGTNVNWYSHYGKQYGSSSKN